MYDRLILYFKVKESGTVDRNGLDSPQELLDHSTLPMRPFVTPLYFVVIFQSINLTLYIMQFPWSVTVFLAQILKDIK